MAQNRARRLSWRQRIFAGPTHAYLGLFTSAGLSSGLALAEGICWSVLFGALVGAVFAAIYNMTGEIGHR